jgi:hypothetical protein
MWVQVSGQVRRIDDFVAGHVKGQNDHFSVARIASSFAENKKALPTTWMEPVTSQLKAAAQHNKEPRKRFMTGLESKIRALVSDHRRNIVTRTNNYDVPKELLVVVHTGSHFGCG